MNEVADYWEKVVQMNEYQQERFVKKIIKEMFNTIVGKKDRAAGICLQGQHGRHAGIAGHLRGQKTARGAGRPGDLRSPGPGQRPQGPGRPGWRGELRSAIPTGRSIDAHAIAVITEWDVFKKLDFEKVFSVMQKPAFVFDGRNILDHQRLFQIGFNVFPLGKPSLTHF